MCPPLKLILICFKPIFVKEIFQRTKEKVSEASHNKRLIIGKDPFVRTSSHYDLVSNCCLDVLLRLAQ